MEDILEGKNLEEIMDVARAKVSAYKELEEKRWTLEKDAVAVVNGNFKTLFYSEISQLFYFCVTLSRTIDKDVPLNGYDTEEFKQSYAWEDFFLSMRYLNNDLNKTFLMYFRGDDGKMHSWDLRSLKEKKTSDYILSWFPYFGTEEDTLKTLEKARRCFAVWLGRYLQCLDSRYNQLEVTVRALEDALKGGSAVKEKEDGTIELKINGKVYVGKVKEEE